MDKCKDFTDSLCVHDAWIWVNSGIDRKATSVVHSVVSDSNIGIEWVLCVLATVVHIDIW